MKAYRYFRSQFSGIFTKIANLTSEISPDLPPGGVKLKEKFVKSAPISIPGAKSQCYINGRFEAVIEFDDGSYGIVDYKISEAKDEHASSIAGSCRRMPTPWNIQRPML
jgi:hypothetical protein